MTDQPIFDKSYLQIKDQTGQCLIHDIAITPALSDDDDEEIIAKLAELAELEEEDNEIADQIDTFLEEKGYRRVNLDVKTYIFNPVEL